MGNFVDTQSGSKHCERLLMHMHEPESEFAEYGWTTFSVQGVLKAMNSVAVG